MKTRTIGPSPSDMSRVVLALMATMITALVILVTDQSPASAGQFTATVTHKGGTKYVNVRKSANTSSAILRRISSGRRVGLNCWTRGTAVRGPYGVSTIWYSIDGGGWTTDALLETGTNSPVTSSCPSAGTDRASKAVTWANSMLGSRAYNGWCQRFVENAYGTAGRFRSALAAFNALKASGRMRYTTKIPAGALVFSRNKWDGGNGHVMLARGNGTFVNPLSTVRITRSPAGGSGSAYRFLGWSYAPSDWAGRR